MRVECQTVGIGWPTVTRPADSTNDQILPAASRSCVCGHPVYFPGNSPCCGRACCLHHRAVWPRSLSRGPRGRAFRERQAGAIRRRCSPLARRLRCASDDVPDNVRESRRYRGLDFLTTRCRAALMYLVTAHYRFQISSSAKTRLSPASGAVPPDPAHRGVGPRCSDRHGIFRPDLYYLCWRPASAQSRTVA